MPHPSLTSPALPAAGLPRRLAAMGYDTLLSVPLAMAVTALSVAAKTAWVGAGTIQKSGAAALQASDPLYWLNLLLVMLAVTAFFVWFWTRAGQTLGMQAWRLRIDRLDGGRINSRQALLRLAGAAVSLACGGLGYWAALWDPEKRTWHDRWSGSRVVLLPKPPKA